jgi:hypothetical protein
VKKNNKIKDEIIKGNEELKQEKVKWKERTDAREERDNLMIGDK